MSAEHEHAADPAAKPHDPRLDSSGEEHPGVKPLPFDLIALENTRLGLRVQGLGLGLVSIALPWVSGTRASAHESISFAGWALTIVGLLSMFLAVAICAPTPHGPLPRLARACAGFVMLVAATSSIVHCVHGLFPGRLHVLSGPVSAHVARAIDDSARVVLLAYPWILWRFCQHRGLTGRAIVWLWIAMASSALGLGAFVAEWRGVSWGWLPIGYRAFVPLGLIAFFAAQHTARDVWLDAVYRNTKFHATNRSDAVVEPLRPANER